MTTNFEGREILDDDELKAAFADLFPHGWAGADVLAELAPDGWAASPLTAVFHPSADQVFEEAVRAHRGLSLLRRPDAPPTPEPTRADYPAAFDAPEFDPVQECRELVGRCLWDVFSDNHEVTDAAGRLFDLGSHRSAGGVLADILNAQGGPPPPPKPEPPPELMAMLRKTDGSPQAEAFMQDMLKEMYGDGGYTYLDFYMGSGTVSGRADLTAVYEMIFRRLRAHDLDWEYSFPRIGLVDFRPLKKALDEKEREERGESEWDGYDPAKAMEEEAADRKHDEEVAEMQERLDEGHREAVAEAREAEPPAVVRAYAAVYGDFPTGWPPEA